MAKGDGGSMTFRFRWVVWLAWSFLIMYAEVLWNYPSMHLYGGYMSVHYFCTDHMGFASSQRDVVVERRITNSASMSGIISWLVQAQFQQRVLRLLKGSWTGAGLNVGACWKRRGG